MSALAVRVGIDIGGTFTDGVVVDEATGTVAIHKVPTTPADPSEGFLDALLGGVERSGATPDQVQGLIHATTVATNALLERRGARAGLLVTDGFRDVLEIARQVRHDLYDLQTTKPPALIPRERSRAIPERLDHEGRVVVPLDEDAVAEAADALVADGVEAIAICFLHAYRNDVHETRAAEIVRSRHPQIPVSVSSEVVPEIREYWRASTTATNAYVAPIVERYLTSLEGKLDDARVRAPLHVVQSSGGVMTVARAKAAPVLMLESGPASGVAAAAFHARLLGYPDAISFDMGGTTAKAGLIRDGRPAVLAEFEAGAETGSGAGTARGSGYPILGAVTDLVEISSGGGSIAWVDGGGLMRVGPRSAGAVPGPACYGRGGTRPTVTDANLVLGRLDADSFLGGRMRLDREAAETAIRVHCAEPLGLDVVAAAVGIVAIANAAMGESLRLVSVQRGLDPRDFALVAFGGAGPLHANRLAAELSIPTLIVPPSPGVASALGMLVSDLRRDERVTRVEPLDGADVQAIETTLARLEAGARAALTEDGFGDDDIVLERAAGLRYVGQSWRLDIALPARRVDAVVLAGVATAFHREHERRYGYCVPDEPIELVTLGLQATGRIRTPQLATLPQGGPSPDAALRGSRAVFGEERSEFVMCPVYDRYALVAGNAIAGPAIVEELDSSVVISDGWHATVARQGGLLVQRAETTQQERGGSHE
jgi:N-methylhydantoinase A/oxoprolinase/acetone carboxylase beta subunit